MYLKVLIFFVISFSFTFVNSFIESSILNEILEEHAKMWQNADYVDNNAHIKSFGIKKLSSICFFIIKRLRKEEEYKNMYVNYLLFKHNENKNLCIDIKIWVPLLNEFIKAPACHCFGRPAILSLEYPQETFQRFQELMFYPLNSDIIAVYKINFSSETYYTLLEIVTCGNWSQIDKTDDDLFAIPVPIGYCTNVKLNEIWDILISQLTSQQASRSLNTVEGKMFPALCELILRRPKYENEIIYKKPTARRKPVPSCVRAFPPGSSSFYNINAYTCKGVVPQTSNITWKYRIANGPKKDSVIVLKGITYDEEMAIRSNVNQQIDTTNHGNLHHGFLCHFADASCSTTNTNENNVPTTISDITDHKSYNYFVVIEYIEDIANSKFLNALFSKKY